MSLLTKSFVKQHRNKMNYGNQLLYFEGKKILTYFFYIKVLINLKLRI